MIRTGLFKFVPHEQVDAHHQAGWMIVQADLGRYHGSFSVLMWRCGCAELNHRRRSAEPRD